MSNICFPPEAFCLDGSFFFGRKLFLWVVFFWILLLVVSLHSISLRNVHLSVCLYVYMPLAVGAFPSNWYYFPQKNLVNEVSALLHDIHVAAQSGFAPTVEVRFCKNLLQYLVHIFYSTYFCWFKYIHDRLLRTHFVTLFHDRLPRDHFSPSGRSGPTFYLFTGFASNCHTSRFRPPMKHITTHENFHLPSKVYLKSERRFFCVQYCCVFVFYISLLFSSRPKTEHVRCQPSFPTSVISRMRRLLVGYAPTMSGAEKICFF